MGDVIGGMMGYQKTQELKVIRTKHKITGSTFTTVEQLINDLKQVPLNSTVDEILVDYEQPTTTFSIEFHEERVGD